MTVHLWKPVGDVEVCLCYPGLGACSSMVTTIGFPVEFDWLKEVSKCLHAWNNFPSPQGLIDPSSSMLSPWQYRHKVLESAARMGATMPNLCSASMAPFTHNWLLFSQPCLHTFSLGIWFGKTFLEQFFFFFWPLFLSLLLVWLDSGMMRIQISWFSFPFDTSQATDMWTAVIKTLQLNELWWAVLSQPIQWYVST